MGKTGWMVALVLAVSATAVRADGPWKYQFKDHPDPVYDVEITYQLPDAEVTQQGRLYYTIKSVDPANGQVTLSYSAQLGTNRKELHPQDHGPFSHIPRPSFPDPWAAPSAPPEVVIDAVGRLVRTNRDWDSDQLEAMMGQAWRLMLPPLSPQDPSTWTVQTPVSLADKKPQPQRMGSVPPWERQETQQQVQSAQETQVFTITQSNDQSLTIHEKRELASDEKVGAAPRQGFHGEGDYTFDKATGMLTALDYQQTIEVNAQNVTVKIPVQVKARLLSEEEMRQMREAQKAAQARWEKENAQRETERKVTQAQNEEARRLADEARRQRDQTQRAKDDALKAQARVDMLKSRPTAAQAQEQFKTIAAAWQPTPGTPRDILPDLQGNCDKLADGAVLLRQGDELRSSVFYRPPVTFRIIALTELNDTRIAYPGRQVIFNWEMNNCELRVDGGPVSGRHQPGAGLLPPKRWVGIEMIVKQDEMIMYVDGREIYRQRADFTTVVQPFAIAAHSNGDLRLKSIEVIQ